MGLEQAFGGACPNLSFPATWVEWSIFIEWPTAGLT
jgi:hypothetical protein